MSNLMHLRLAFVALAAVLAATLAWGLMRGEAPAAGAAQRLSVAAPSRPEAGIRSQPAALPAQPRPQPGDQVLRERALIEAGLSQSQDYAGFTRKLAANWPADWSALLDRLAQRRATGELSDNPDAWMAEALRELRRSRGVLAAKASPAALARVLSAQSATLSALSVIDKRLCVDFLFGQPSEAFLQFSSRHRGLIAQMANAALDAIIDGSAANLVRQPPNDADFDVLEAAMRSNGLDKLEIEAMLDGRHPDPPLSDERLCKAGIIYLETFKTIPEAARLRLNSLAVELMARM